VKNNGRVENKALDHINREINGGESVKGEAMIRVKPLITHAKRLSKDMEEDGCRLFVAERGKYDGGRDVG